MHRKKFTVYDRGCIDVSKSAPRQTLRASGSTLPPPPVLAQHECPSALPPPRNSPDRCEFCHKTTCLSIEGILIPRKKDSITENMPLKYAFSSHGT